MSDKLGAAGIHANQQYFEALATKALIDSRLFGSTATMYKQAYIRMTAPKKFKLTVVTRGESDER